jgi:glycosyltransferase involved in cell wall biosynthesis
MSRIVVLTPWDRMWSLAGGGAPSWAYLIEGMLAAGHHVDVLAAPGETRDYPDHPRLRVLRTAPLTVAGGPLLRGRTWLQRTRQLVAGAWAYSRANGRPDLVYGFSALATPAAAICATSWRRPSVGKLFGTFLLPAVGHPARLHEKWDEALGFRAPLTRLVVHDDGTGGDIVARWLRVPAGRLCFWRNGVDRVACDAARAAADPVAVRAEVGLAADTPLIYTASRLVNWKRVDRIVRAMQGVLERQPSARLVIGGEGGEREALQRLAAEIGVERAVIFAGSVPRERNLRLMAAADVFTATYDYSNLGNALQEAMSCGAPVVVTDTGRTRELVADGTAGLVVAPDDTRALADALASVLGDLALRERLAAGALHAATTKLPSKEERIGWEVAMVEGLIDARRRS